MKDTVNIITALFFVVVVQHGFKGIKDYELLYKVQEAIRLLSFLFLKRIQKSRLKKRIL